MKLTCKAKQDAFTARISESFDFDFDGEITTEIRDLPELPDSYSIGVIVGPSGSGKSTLLQTVGEIEEPKWGKGSVGSHFDDPDDMVEKFGAVGFSSMPQWCLPYRVLSNGEKFRCDLARKLKDGALIDEYTSVVNREVAKSASSALRRHVDKHNLKKITLATCHYDILEWVQPDWVFNTMNGEFYSGRRLRRPQVKIDVYRGNWRLWDTFKKFHYLSAKMNKASHCYAAFWGDQLVGFVAVLAMPGMIKNAWRASRTVILPDFQGLGIGNRLSETVAQMYIDKGCRYFSRTAHPRMGKHREKSLLWRPTCKNRTLRKDIKRERMFRGHWTDDKRICWSHEYIGNEKS